MSSKFSPKLTRFFPLVAFVFMIGVNVLANVLPLGGVTTGEVSIRYTNLFTPVGFTFSIWGIIYLALMGSLVQRFFGMGSLKAVAPTELLVYDGLFGLSSLLNGAWLFSWHYQLLPLSLLLIVALFLSLAAINLRLRRWPVSGATRGVLTIPFAIYFGWLSVAVIANVSVLLVSLGVPALGAGPVAATVVILLVGMAIGVVTALRLPSVAYALVFIWAYGGILYRHLSPVGYGGAYPIIVGTLVVALVAFGGTALYLLWKKGIAAL